MFKIIKTVIQPNGFPLHIVETTNKSGGEWFAMGKRYWVGYGDGHATRSIHCSNNLKYIEKKFKEYV